VTNTPDIGVAVMSRITPLLMAVFLSGCFASKQTGGEIMIVDGCIVTVKGFSGAQADEIMKTWNIDPNCSVEVKTEID